MRENKILITGVGGFIGSKVARRFQEEGFDVIGIDDLSTGKLVNVPVEIEFIQGDLSLEKTITKIPFDCCKILHLAGQSSGEISFEDPILDLKKNTISTLNLIKFGIENNVERFVYASSMSVYGNVANCPISELVSCAPLSCYGVGKMTAERYLQIYSDQLPFVSLRMFNVYGPGQDMDNLKQGMVSIFLEQALRSNTIQVKGSLDRFRDLIYISDVVELWYRATLEVKAKNQIINIGTGTRTTVRSLLNEICQLLPGRTYYEEDVTPGDQTGIYADNCKLLNLFGKYNFIPLNQGLKEFYEYSSKRKIL